ncbi:MAG: pectate lyase [Bacteroidales bacterium]|nr:pectate lyase [Bacteroidales bacterium]
MKQSFISIVMFVAIAAMAQAASKPPKQVYIPMDYSACGYRASECDIPDVKALVYVEPAQGDSYERIQRAIDYVSAQPADADGRRGAVILTKGTYEISQPLRITTSGVTLRGEDRDATVLRKMGYDRGGAIYIEGKYELPASNDVYIDGNVAAGSLGIPLDNASDFKVGQAIRIVRPCTDEWIEHLGMNDFGGGLDYTGWKATDIDITWNRTIVKVSPDSIWIDAPITTAITQEYGGAYIYAKQASGALVECGVENITIDSYVNTWNSKDEDHCWDGVWLNNARDCWIRYVRFQHLAGSAVNIQKNVQRVTVEDCISEKPVSEIGGWRRQTFLTRGEQCLFQRCVSYEGIHDFSAGYCAAGPNAFVMCDAVETNGFSGSTGSWAAGLLFDIVNIDGDDLNLCNLEQFQFGTGWNAANSMVWQSTASTIRIYSPDADNRNSGHGCWGTLTGNAEWTSSNDHVNPRSLFYDQLKRRGIERDGRILFMGGEATSSPTVEQAYKLAQESLTKPRVTMQMWIDSAKCAASTSIVSIKNIDALTKPAKSVPIVMHKFAVENGYLTCDGALIVGNRYDIPWWSGRVKDNFIPYAKPAITRFVPGREGTAWTDRIDSVAAYMKANGYAMLDHNYGLWYDLRRTDHERVRRADGDVWAPFYEQPFARSGQGIAWDGLSKYDLTKPNNWYWNRLRQYATASAGNGGVLYVQHYFQHNILEAGAHWVDCPWRPVNNINNTYPFFPEPVPFAGDKRVFMAEQFYNIENADLRAMHRAYIRMCLDQTKDCPNVIHSLSAEYTGPTKFVRFWLETIDEWQRETGRNVLVALACTKDAQDAILADAELSNVVDIIDIRYWHYNTKGLWAPEAGKNLAPRQWTRKVKVGKTTGEEAFKAVSEYRKAYPDKAVAFFSQQYPQYARYILMGGGSICNINIDKNLAQAVVSMSPVEGEACYVLQGENGMLICAQHTGDANVNVEPGKYEVFSVDSKGAVKRVAKSVKLEGKQNVAGLNAGSFVWLKRR